MTVDISLKGLEIKHNGLSKNIKKGADGILSISWFHCRPDLTEPVLKWIVKLDDIKKNSSVSLSSFKAYEKLAFRQNAVGESILKVEVITSYEYPLIAKLVVGVLGLGFKTVGGLITSPVAASLFDTLVSQLEIDVDKPTIYKIGSGQYIVNPNEKLPGEVKIPLILDTDFVIQNEEKSPVNGQILKEGISISKGENGLVTLNITEFDPKQSIDIK